jgi:hypothetical protein
LGESANRESWFREPHCTTRFFFMTFVKISATISLEEGADMEKP